MKFATQLLHQFNPGISDVDAERVAGELYESTKGQKSKSKAFNGGRAFWRGGTESVVFNKLEAIAEQDIPRTPVLGCSITEALMRRYINKGGFMPSRINWVIQSSGVDYLHLLIVSMEHLITTYGIDARLSITVHDEIRYLVKSDDACRAAMALQISNLWTRALFCEQLGIFDVPQVCPIHLWTNMCEGSGIFLKCRYRSCTTKGSEHGMRHAFPSDPNTAWGIFRHLSTTHEVRCQTWVSKNHQ